MARYIFAVICFLAFSFPVHAICVNVPAPQVPREQRTSIAHSLADSAGSDEVPTDGQGLQPGQSRLDDICFPTFDPTGIITDQSMTDLYNTQKAADDAATVIEIARQQGFEDEIAGVGGNDLCDAELTDIDTKIDAGVDGFNNLAEAKVFLRSALKKIARCVRARAR